MLIGLILVVVKTSSVRAVHRDELGDAAKDIEKAISHAY